MTKNLKKEAVTGVKWTTVSTIILAVTGILKLSILTRYLDKSDFGLMALVTFVLGIMNLFMDMGLTSAILHKQVISKNEYSSLYWLNMIFSFLLFGCMILITPGVSSFYEEIELNSLIPLMGLSLPISAIGKQFKTKQEKELKFKGLAIIDGVAMIISLLYAIWLAVNGFGVYSLVYSALLQYIIANISYFILGMKNMAITFHFKFSETVSFLKIGIYQVGGQLINYFNRDLDILIIGKFFSTEILGGYSLAKQLVFRPAQLINPILMRVASPVLAKFQGTLDILKLNYLKLISLVSLINTFVYIMIIVFAPIIVEIMYGVEYIGITPLVRILSVYMIIRSIGNPVGSLVIATGRTDLEFVWNILVLLVMPIPIYFSAHYSINYVAWTITVLMILLFVPSWYFLIRKMTKSTLREYVIACFNYSFAYKTIYNLLPPKFKK